MGIFNKTKDIHICNTQHPLFQYFLMQEIKTDIILTSNVLLDDLVINVSPGHGFIVGEFIVLWANSICIQSIVKNVNVDQITIDAPCPIPFSVSDTKVIRGNIDMNKDFSSSSTDFIFKMYNSLAHICIHAIIVTMRHALNADDGRFGGIPALVKGILFRSTNEKNVNMGVYKSNQDFKDRGAKITYTDRAPAGTYSTDVQFNILESFGQAIGISPEKDEYIFARMQDDLSALSLMHVSLLGCYKEG